MFCRVILGFYYENISTAKFIDMITHLIFPISLFYIYQLYSPLFSFQVITFPHFIISSNTSSPFFYFKQQLYLSLPLFYPLFLIQMNFENFITLRASHSQQPNILFHHHVGKNYLFHHHVGHNYANKTHSCLKVVLVSNNSLYIHSSNNQSLMQIQSAHPPRSIPQILSSASSLGIFSLNST